MNEKEQYYAIYSRKSKFTGKGESIENQIEKCKEKLLYKYGEEIKDKIKVYQDEGFTGYNTNRTEFQKMFKDIKDKKIKNSDYELIINLLSEKLEIAKEVKKIL